MGAESSKIESIVFRPPNPHTYREDEFQEFLWIPQWNNEPRKVPAIWLPWRESTQTTVLVSHDYGEDLGSIMGELQMLRETLHVNVVGYDYAGYGLSKASPSETACNNDAISVLRWLVVTKGIPTSRIILFGRTLGTGPTLTLACTSLASGAMSMPPAPVVVVSSPSIAPDASAAATLNQLLLIDPNAPPPAARASGEISKATAAAALVEQSTNGSGTAAAPPATSKGFFGNQRAPRLAGDDNPNSNQQAVRATSSPSLTAGGGTAVPPTFAGIVLMAPMLSVLALKDGAAGNLLNALPGTPTDMFENVKRIDKCVSPLFITYAAADELVPSGHAQKLAKKVTPSAKLWRLLELKDTHHNLMYRNDDYLDALIEFLRHVTGAPAAPAVAKPVPVQFSSAPATVVGDWLRAHDLGQYSDVFLQEGYYDMTAIRSIRDTDPLWERIEPTHRPKLQSAIEQSHRPAGANGTSSSLAPKDKDGKDGTSPMRAVSPIRGKMPSNKTTPKSGSGSLGGLLKNVTKKIAGSSDRVSSDGVKANTVTTEKSDAPFPGIALHSAAPGATPPVKATPSGAGNAHTASVALGSGGALAGSDKATGSSAGPKVVVVKPPSASAPAAPATSTPSTSTTSAAVTTGSGSSLSADTKTRPTAPVSGFQNSPKWPGNQPVAPASSNNPSTNAPGTWAAISRPAGPRGGIAGSERRFQRQRSEPSMHQLIARPAAGTSGSGGPQQSPTTLSGTQSYSLAAASNPRLAAQLAELLSRDDEPAHKLVQKVHAVLAAEPLPPSVVSTPDSRKRFTESLYKFRTEEHHMRSEAAAQQHQHQQKEQRRSGKMNASVMHINQSLHELQGITAARTTLESALQRVNSLQTQTHEDGTRAELAIISTTLQNLDASLRNHETTVQKLMGDFDKPKP